MPKIIYIFLFFLICFINFSAYSKEKKTIRLIRDSEIEFFLQNLINEILVIKNEKINTIKPRILLNNEVNAFVTSGDKIFINTGLLETISSVDEIQGILAHEIGHLLLGHFQSRKTFNKKNTNRMSLALFTMLGASLANSETDLSGLILATKDLKLKHASKYNKQQEMEADIFAIKSLRKLNRTLNGLKTFFKKVDEKQKLLTNNNFYNYYSSHPSPDNRLELMENFSNDGEIKKTLNFGKFTTS